MKFEVDYQTLNDLEIFNIVKKENSVFRLFNFTQCLGGREKLYEFLSTPSSDINVINERKDSIAFFQKYVPEGLNVNKDSLDFAEFYLRNAHAPLRQPTVFAPIGRILDKLNPNSDRFVIDKGVISVVDLLDTVYSFSKKLNDQLEANPCPKYLKQNNEKVLELFSQPIYSEIIRHKKPNAFNTIRFDRMFRLTDKKIISFFLNMIYEYDAFFTIAKTSEKYGFSYPEIVPETENCFEVEGLFHPFVKDAIANDLKFEEISNLLFVSGPNMAGKSTFLKALGVATYLAHAGFPVPAKRMKVSALSGICTTINIADNLSSGYSHFYAEVMRIKDVANKLTTNRNMLVIFDELFRGTNVKDAYDGTLAIVSAFSHVKSSFFVISTHIVEVAKELEINDKIQFCYFEVDKESGYPTYTYKLRDGVSDVRLGMYIINNEKLVEQIHAIMN
ncbi:MAG: hypothetical protein QM660_00860 [Dysgonomonas sp.]